MSRHDAPPRWSRGAKLLHWLMALLMIGLLALGVYMTEFVTDLVRRYELSQWHKSFGFVVFCLAALRVLWRLAGPPAPPIPDTAKPWEKRAAHATHVLLYALMFALPLTGWLMASASPLNDPGAYPAQVRNMVFGLFEMPDPFPRGDKALTELLALAHELAAWALAAVLALHVAGALKHHLIYRDNVLLRMLPFARLRNEKGGA